MALGLSLLAILDICVYLSHRKHKAIIHENYLSPHMSFKMLYANSTFKHWFALALFGAICMFIGYFYAAMP
jgi:1,4-dihydroxy-2-naphthoate octaprenyltransferase